MASKKVIAELAGVSKTTVTRVLANDKLVAPKTREKILKIIEDIGYTKNELAENLAKNKTSKSIALMVPDMTNYYYLQLFNKMVETVPEYGYEIMIYHTNMEIAADVVNSIVANRVYAIINLGIGISEYSYKRVKAAGIKMIYSGWDQVFAFKHNYYQAIDEAFRHFKKIGCKNPGFFFGADNSYSKDQRLKDFKECGRVHGYGDLENNIVYGGHVFHKSALAMGYQMAKRIYADSLTYDAVFCVNDMAAMGVIRGIDERGYRVPEDVSVIGFDNIMLGEYCHPSLSTIDTHIEKEAEAYIKFLAGAIEEKVTGEPAELILRGSVKR